MLGLVSSISVVFGAAAACVAGRFPMRRETIETGAGFLLIGGLALMGSALPAVL
jgi:hypothetical protein